MAAVGHFGGLVMADGALPMRVSRLHHPYGNQRPSRPRRVPQAGQNGMSGSRLDMRPSASWSPQRPLRVVRYERS
jgi:hypothetical protein